jgi:hypothetical protein
VPIQPKGGVLVSPQEAGFPFAHDVRCHTCRHPSRGYIEALLAAGCHYRQVRALLSGMGWWAPSVRSLSNHHSAHMRPGAQLDRVRIEESVARCLAASGGLLQEIVCAPGDPPQ